MPNSVHLADRLRMQPKKQPSQMRGWLAALALSLAFVVVFVPATAATQPHEPSASLVGQDPSWSLQVLAWHRPYFPRQAIADGLEGEVVVEVSVSPRAEIVQAIASSGPDVLRRAAELAAQEWRFAFGPHAHPVPTTVRLTFTFDEDQGHHFASLGFITDPKLSPKLPNPGPPVSEPEVVRARPDEQAGIRPPSLPVPPPATQSKPQGDTLVVTKPKVHNSPRPSYTQLARQNKTEGNVKVKALLGADGKVSRTVVVAGLPDGLSSKAVEAVHRLEYTPATNGAGEPVDCWLVIQVNYTLR